MLRCKLDRATTRESVDSTNVVESVRREVALMFHVILSYERLPPAGSTLHMQCSHHEISTVGFHDTLHAAMCQHLERLPEYWNLHVLSKER
jgi:hypothetical protein